MQPYVWLQEKVSENDRNLICTFFLFVCLFYSKVVEFLAFFLTSLLNLYIVSFLGPDREIISNIRISLYFAQNLSCQITMRKKMIFFSIFPPLPFLLFFLGDKTLLSLEQVELSMEMLLYTLLHINPQN